MLRAAAERAEQAEAQPRSNRWSRLTPEAVDEALTMIGRGNPPGPHWWLRHDPPSGPGCYPRPVPKPSHQKWEPWELVSAAIAHAEYGEPLATAKCTLAYLAADHGLGADDLALAFAALEDSTS